MITTIGTWVGLEVGEAVTDWWYGEPDDVGFTTVPDYGESAIDVPAAAPRASTAPPASSGAGTGNGAPPPPPAPDTSSTLSPLWVGAGVVLLGLGGYYAYRATR